MAQDADSLPPIDFSEPNSDVPGIALGNVTPTPNVQDAIPRAQKNDYALGAKSPGQQALTQAITTPGAEDHLRESLARAQDVQDLTLKNKIVQNLITNRDPALPVTQDDVDYVQSLTRSDLAGVRHDPQTFFEQLFARRVL